MVNRTVILAGGTGNLGGRIARALRSLGAEVRALVRPDTTQQKIDELKNLGIATPVVDFRSATAIASACGGVSCVVSALSGLRDVIVESQTVLLEGAIAAGVPRFIPSDYSIDFTKFPAGENRNLDFRREFHQRLDRAAIAATTVFAGAFTELLMDEMPLILWKWKRILYWGNADQRMDFTTMDDTAEFTAHAALDSATPRFLRIAGDELSAREMAAVASDVTGERFRLFRPGGLGMLDGLIKVTRAIAPGKDDLYPAWQGMQYMRNMLDGRGKLVPLDNDRYPEIQLTRVKEYLAAARNSQRDTTIQPEP